MLGLQPDVGAALGNLMLEITRAFATRNGTWESRRLQLMKGSDARISRAMRYIGSHLSEALTCEDGIPLAFAHLAESLVGTKLEASDIGGVADDAAEQIEPHEDLHASADYRRHLARVLVTRVIAQARERSYTAARVS